MQSPVSAEAGFQQVHMAHAVKQREDRGVRPNSRLKRIHGRFKVIGFATEQDEIEGALEFLRHDRRRGGEVEIAKRAPDHQTGIRQLGGAALADQERHVPAGIQQPAAEIAADAAGSDHKNSHVFLSPKVAGEGADEGYEQETALSTDVTRQTDVIRTECERMSGLLC
jgi:hypothetical protein